MLEERTRAKEREQRLKEEIQRERNMIPRLVNEKVDQILKEKEREMREEIYASIDTRSLGGPIGRADAQESAADNKETAWQRQEIENLRQQLQVTQRQLAESEARYEDEKKQLLHLRTTQLKSESNRKGQEGDIIGKAMQVMSEYEEIIRSSEENSLARLAHHMESFEKEWVRRAREFEEQKADFEAGIMDKALGALQAQSQDVDAIGQRITEKTLQLIRSQGETRLKLEEEILQHSEAFKQQYKDILEHEFRERCRAYDEDFADREKRLVDILRTERSRIIEAERAAIERHEHSQMDALTDAMRDITSLREQLVREHQEAQAKSIEQLLKRRDEMQSEQERVIQEASDRVGKIEKQCFDAVEAAQRSLRDMQLTMAERETEMAEKLITVDLDRERGRVEELTQVRSEVENQWKEVLDEVRRQHSEELTNQLRELQGRIDHIHTEQFQREQELRRNYEAKLVRMEESADERWSKRVQETTRSLDRHLEVIQALREDNEQLSAQLAALQEQFELRETEVATKISTVQREHEQIWHKKMDEMRQRYDRLLEEAMGGSSGEAVSKVEYNRVVGLQHSTEEMLVSFKKKEAERTSAERKQLNELWQGRLEEERADRAVWEQDQLKKLAELRVEIQADARRKETDLLRRLEQERLQLHDNHTHKVLEEKRDRDAFEEQLRQECEAKIREYEQEFEDAYEERVRAMDARYQEKELLIEKRRQEMRKEVAEHEQANKRKAAEWLEKEKDEILADVRKFHEKLVAEERRLQDHKVAFEKEVQSKYADMFETARQKLHAEAFEMSNIHMTHWQECERLWLESREAEIGTVFQMKSDFEARMHDAVAKTRQTIQENTNEILSQERARLDERELKLTEQMEAARLAAEEASRERAVRLLDERNKLQEESERARVAEEAQVWERLKLRVMERERELETHKRQMEAALRSKYENLVVSEKRRVDKLMEDHVIEQREITLRTEADARAREEQWQAHRLEVEQTEREVHERRYLELRKQYEDRVTQEREHHERILRAREMEFEDERTRFLDSVERQYKDHETAMRIQISKMKDDYEHRIRSSIVEANQLREKYISDIAEQQAKLAGERDNYESESLSRFEQSLTELRNVLERRTREQQVKEIEAKAALERGKKEYEERINRQYEELVKEHQESLMALTKDREERAAKAEEERRSQLLDLRNEMESSISKMMETCDRRAQELAGESIDHFKNKLKESSDQLTEERNKRVESEARVQDLLLEIEVLRSGVEQHKLDIHKSIHAKFEVLFADLREKTRQEKEELARALLEEEERKVAKELALRDMDYRLQGPRAMNNASAGTSGPNNAPAPSAPRTVPPPTTTPKQPTQQTTYPTPPASRPTTSTPLDLAAAEQLAKKKERLKQLWQLLDVPQQERDAFVGTLEGPPADVLGAAAQEVRVLEAMLPMLEAITRKEFSQHRILELSNKEGQEAKITALFSELDDLRIKLMSDIRRFEARFERPFTFRGKRYLSILEVEEERRQEDPSATPRHPPSTPRAVLPTPRR